VFNPVFKAFAVWAKLTASDATAGSKADDTHDVKTHVDPITNLIHTALRTSLLITTTAATHARMRVFT
jgi:hypothetical protein